MARLGTSKRPAVVRVRSVTKAEEIVSFCDEHGWQVIVGIEPEEVEDLADLEKLIGGTAPTRPAVAPEPKIGRNEPCPCGSGKKFKKCCGQNAPRTSTDSGHALAEKQPAPFVPIGLNEYVELHMTLDRGESAAQLQARLQETVALIKAGQRCACGNKPWAIGSAVAGLGCFTCITGEAEPSGDYELVEVLDGAI